MKHYLFGLLLFVLAGCSTSSPGLFSRKSPHEQYSERLTRAGLQQTLLGKAWFDAATASLQRPLRISIPYKETGYFGADQPTALGLRFSAKRGQLIRISLQKNPSAQFQIYYELWQISEGDAPPKRVALPDTNTLALQHEVRREEEFLLRLQPELLAAGEYTLSISVNPSLAYPVVDPEKNPTKSFWGATRDAGARRHEGIDIFAPKRTPAIAAANGTIERVNENNLGGKVVWLRPEGKDYVLYYAHLDTQIARNGQEVRVGDTVGLVGNTGNARTTPPHLHFGIYAIGGAVDPFPFVNPRVPEVPDIDGDTDGLGRWVSTSRNTQVFREIPGRDGFRQLPRTTPVQLLSAIRGYYRIRLPDDSVGYIASSVVERSPATLVLRDRVLLHDAPDTTAPRIASIPAGRSVQVVGSYGDFRLIDQGNGRIGWIR